MKNVVKVVFYGAFIALCIWFFLSWVDIVADNSQPNPTHSQYNMFVLMTK